ncbi:prohibitin family protein [Chroococcidiopsis sp.]|uniref:prohibitin family protein n=1 Tax=Chroococcidiopsis sp. TaxID=3088168 RepID=UPI003F3916A2
MRLWILLLCAIGTLFASTSCSIIDPGEVGVKSSLGSVKSAALQPGVHLSIPLVDWITTFDSRVQAAPEEFSALTSDGQSVKVFGTLNFRISAQHAPVIFSQVGKTTVEVKDRIVQPILLSVVKEVVAKQSMTELIANQAAFSTDVGAALQQRLTQEMIAGFSKGAIAEVDSFNITGLKLDETVQAAIEKTAISKQALLTAQSELKVAEMEAKRNEALQKTLTAEVLMNKAIQKWTGEGVPPTLSSNSQLLFKVGK